MRCLSTAAKEAACGKTEYVCRRATDAYILIMTAVFPLFTWPEGYISLNEKKFAFFAVCTVCWTLLICSCAAVRLAAGKRPDIRVADRLVLAFMGACIASTVLSPGASFLSLDTGRCDGLLTYLLYGCIFLGVSHFGTMRGEYVYIFGASCFLCCLIALLQLLGYNPFGLYPNGLTYYDPFVQETGRFLGTVGNIDLLSALNTIAVPIMCAGCVLGNNRLRYLLLIPAGAGIFITAAAGVASGILAMLLTAIVFFPAMAADLYSRRAGGMRSDRAACKIRCCSSAVSACVFAAVIIIIYFRPGNNVTLLELQSVLHGNLDDSFGSGRILIWKKVLKLIGEHPVFGIGPDCLGSALDIRFSRYSELLGQTLVSAADNAHNEYLQLLASFGLCGFLPLAAVFIMTWVLIARHRRSHRLTALLCPGLFCYMIQAFFNLGLCITTPLFLIFFALVWTDTEHGSIKCTAIDSAHK